MAKRQGNSPKGRKYDPRVLRRQSDTRRDAQAFALSHRYDQADTGGGALTLNSGVPDAPVIGVGNSLAQAHASRYEVTLGLDIPGPAYSLPVAKNWDFTYTSSPITEIQIATDAGFTGLNGGAILDRTFSVPPPLETDFATNYPGVYYFRARVKNEIGWGAWRTISFTTDALDSLTTDTDLMPGATPTLAVGGSANPQLGGNETLVTFDIPTSQSATAWGYQIVIHDSATLPTDTLFDSGTHGAIVPNVLVLTDTTKSWTVNALVGKNLRIFSNKRGGSPSWDYEGAIIDSPILANTATTITFSGAAQTQNHNLSGLTYHICNAGDSMTEKVKYISPPIVDLALIAGQAAQGSARLRSVRVPVAFTPHYAWVAFYNTFGAGKIGSSAAASISGIRTIEINGTAAGNGAVTATKTNIVNLGDITLNLGTVQTGLLRTASSGARIEIDSTNGIRAFDSGGTVQTRIPVGSNAGLLFTSNLIAQDTSLGVTMQGGIGSWPFVLCKSTDVAIQAESGGKIQLLVASVEKARIDVNGINGNGSGITSLNAGNISSGTLADARLSSNVPLKNAANHFTNDQFIDSSKNLFFSLASGIADASGASVAVNNTQVSINAGSYTERGRFDNGDSTTQTALLVRFNGSVQRVKIDASDLGTGVKNYLYI